MLKEKKNLKFIIIIMLIMLFQVFWISPVNATENGLEKTTEVKEDISNYSEAYKEYLKLSDEEKKNSGVIPRKYNIPLDLIYEDTTVVKESPSLFNLFGLFSEKKVEKAYANEIPEKFDLREKITISQKDQKSYGLCWAFASTRSLETNLALNGYGYYDFSELHMDYLTSSEFGGLRTLHDGGWFDVMVDYALAMDGPVLEETVPYDTIYTKDDYEYLDSLESKAYLIETVDFPTIDKVNNTYTDEELELFRDSVKKHIMENGSVYSSIHTGPIRFVDGAYTKYDTKHQSNHAISVIGWDDNFPKEQFIAPDGSYPKEDGAYIVMNSWGDSTEIIYVSYEDSIIENDMSGVKIASTDKSDLGILETKFNDLNLYNYMIKKLDKSIISSNLETMTISFYENVNIEKIHLNFKAEDNIKDFTGLEVFNVNYLSIENSEFSLNSLSKVTSLEELHINSCKITDINEISNLTNLKRLSMYLSNVADISALKNLTNLKDLFLLNNNIIDITALKDLTNLEELNIGYNQITDISSLSNLIKLKSLSMDGNNISNINPIENLVELKTLVMSSNNIQDINVLSNLTKLEVLYIRIKSNIRYF